jgi:hypothetical protein
MNADAPAPAVSVGHQDGQHSHAMPTSGGALTQVACPRRCIA